MSYLAHVRSKLRQTDPPGVFLDALSKLGLHIFPFYLMVEKVPQGAPPTLRGGPCVFDFMDAARLRELADIPERRVSVTALRDRHKEGMSCFSAICNGAVAAFCWCNRRECHMPACRFPLRDDEAYIFDTFTRLSHRGRGLAVRLRYELFLRLAAEGRTTFYSLSNRFNRASLGMKDKGGATVVHAGVSVRLFGKWCRVSPPDMRADAPRG